MRWGSWVSRNRTLLTPPLKPFSQSSCSSALRSVQRRRETLEPVLTPACPAVQYSGVGFRLEGPGEGGHPLTYRRGDPHSAHGRTHLHFQAAGRQDRHHTCCITHSLTRREAGCFAILAGSECNTVGNVIKIIFKRGGGAVP